MIILFIVLPIIIVDQLLKFYILQRFQSGQSYPILKDIFHITFVSNKGVAFGMFSEQGLMFIWISLIFVIIITFIFTFYKSFFHKRKSVQISLSLILAGAMSNLIDRIRLGFVVDFLDFRIWPVFNIADSVITIGTALLVLQMLRHKPKA